MIYGINDLTSFVVGTILIVLLPGPNSLYVMTVASRLGVAAGYRGACGIFLGDTILMLLSTTGAASFLKTTPALFMAFKYAGAAYLAWMGLGLLRRAIVVWRHGMAPPQLSPSVDGSRPFHSALLISLMNPKAILFFVSFFIQFVDPGYPHPELSFILLGVIVQFFSALYLSILIYGGAGLAAQIRCHPRFAAIGTGAVGGAFVGFAAKLADSTLG